MGTPQSKETIEGVQRELGRGQRSTFVRSLSLAENGSEPPVSSPKSCKVFIAGPPGLLSLGNARECG